MEILTVEHLVKGYGDKQLFNDISFAIAEKERIGLIGVNGTGKSTLIRVIAGIEEADQGSIHHSKDFKITYLKQDPELDPALTVLEEVFAGEATIMVLMRQYEQALLALERKPEDVALQNRLINLQQQMDQFQAWDANTTAKMILTKLGITSFEQTMEQLSGGQKKRVAIAKALIQPADLLLLDEPTNHLDNQSIEWLEGYLSTYQGSIVLITHDRYFLNRITNRIMELEKGKIYRYQGNYETFLEKKAEREALERQNEQKHANTLKRELAWLKRGAKARSTKQKARIDRVEEMKEMKFDTSETKLDVQVATKRLGKKVLELQNVSKSYTGINYVNGLDLLVKPKDRIGIIGANGSGKTTLLQLIAEQVVPDSGEIAIGSTVKIGYYSQNHHDMDQSLRVIEYIRETAEVIHTKDGEIITAEQMLERFLFPRSQQWTYINRLSGGEQRRLYLLQVLMQEPNVLLLDEPTNDLDVQTLSVLEDYLDHFPGVVITVSHDRYFLDRVIDQLIIFSAPGKITSFYGNYSAYLDMNKVSSVQEMSSSVSKPVQSSNTKRKKLSYKDQREWETIEEDIASIEAQIEDVKDEITAAGSDAEKAQVLYQQQMDLETILEQKMERWEALSLLVEEIEQSS